MVVVGALTDPRMTLNVHVDNQNLKWHHRLHYLNDPNLQPKHTVLHILCYHEHIFRLESVAQCSTAPVAYICIAPHIYIIHMVHIWGYTKKLQDCSGLTHQYEKHSTTKEGRLLITLNIH